MSELRAALDAHFPFGIPRTARIRCLCGDHLMSWSEWADHRYEAVRAALAPVAGEGLRVAMCPHCGEELSVVAPPPAPAAPEPLVDGLTLPLDFKVGIAEMSTWDPVRIDRFFGGIAMVLRAIGGQ